MSPEEQPFSDPEHAVDWSTLTIIPNDDQDGEVTMLADEDAVFGAYGFKAAEEAATAAGPEEVPIPSIPTEIQQEWKTQLSLLMTKQLQSLLLTGIGTIQIWMWGPFIP
jgi:hypothetical protein